MSDSELDIKPAKVSVEVPNRDFRPRYDPVPIPRELPKEGRSKDVDEVRKEIEDDKVYDNNDSDEENNKVEKDEEKEDEDKKGVKKPLLEESVTIEIGRPGKEGENTATLPLPEKKKKSITDSETTVDKKQRGKLPVYLFPCTRIKEAWRDSTNICSFVGTAVCIIFQTVGWFTCVGGVPFLSLVMLIIGSVYINDCNIEPNIPVYLIVSGVIGTLQHVITIWTKYVPRETQGRLKVYRSYCQSINGVFHLFMLIWFIIGCVWVYSAHAEVEFRDREKKEYCHKTLYYFAFWILNLSFILLGMIVVLSICFLVCVVATPKDEEKGVIQ